MMLKELVVLGLGHGFVIGVWCAVFSFQGFQIVDFRLDDLHIGHDVDHFTFGEQAFGHKAFVLVTTRGHKDKKQHY